MTGFKTRWMLLFLFATALLGYRTADNGWIAQKQKGFTIHYTTKDKLHEKEYLKLVNKGVTDVSAFFKSSYKSVFDVFIYPDRLSFDTALQRDFRQPAFKSECWLVATGYAHKINILSPGTWDEVPCEFAYTTYADRIKTQRLITHELVHVFHGQLNVNPVFGDSSDIDWFVEGLAFYVSGQLDTAAMTEVKKAMSDKKIPQSLDELSVYSLVNLRYSLSGSLALYIDRKYGREKLKALLPVNKKSEILVLLDTTEPELLGAWQKYILQ